MKRGKGVKQVRSWQEVDVLISSNGCLIEVSLVDADSANILITGILVI